MTEADYCSKVCEGKCCKAAWWLKKPCPLLTDENLCPIYETRLGYRWKAETVNGEQVHCVCSPLKHAAKHMPEEVKAQCCVLHPELLESDLRSPGED